MRQRKANAGPPRATPPESSLLFRGGSFVLRARISMEGREIAKCMWSFRRALLISAAVHGFLWWAVYVLMTTGSNH